MLCLEVTTRAWLLMALFVSGLVCSDDNERVAVCLGVTEQLVRQHQSSAAQVRWSMLLNVSDTRFNLTYIPCHFCQQFVFHKQRFVCQDLAIIFFSSNLIRHLGSPQWSSMVLRHRLLSSAIFLSRPSCSIQSYTLSSVFLFFFRVIPYPLFVYRHLPNYTIMK